LIRNLWDEERGDRHTAVTMNITAESRGSHSGFNGLDVLGYNTVQTDTDIKVSGQLAAFVFRTLQEE
jgi:hypothetical protein